MQTEINQSIRLNGVKNTNGTLQYGSRPNQSFNEGDKRNVKESGANNGSANIGNSKGVNTQVSNTSSKPLPSFNLPPTPITPIYLTTLSQHVSTLTQFYPSQQHSQITQNFTHLLTQALTRHRRSCDTYQNDFVFSHASALICLGQLQSFCVKLLVELLRQQTPVLTEITEFIGEQMMESTRQFELLVVAERKDRYGRLEKDWEGEVNKLKARNDKLATDIGRKNEEIRDMKDQIKDLKAECSEWQHKVVTYVKDSAQEIGISPTKRKQNVSHISLYSQISISGNVSARKMNASKSPSRQQLGGDNQIGSFRPNTTMPERFGLPTSSLISLQTTNIATNINLKPLNIKQLEETIIDILDSKSKIDAIKRTKSPKKSDVSNIKNDLQQKPEINKQRIKASLSIGSYLQSFFRYKFGMKDIADATRENFLSSLSRINRISPSPLTIMFDAMVKQQLYESYYYNEFLQMKANLTKSIISHLKKKAPADAQIEDENTVLLNSNEIEYIFTRIYKTNNPLALLQEVFHFPNQSNVGSANNIRQQKSPQKPDSMTLKEFLAKVLMYEVQKYLAYIYDIAHAVRLVCPPASNGSGQLPTYLTEASLFEIGEALSFNEEKMGQLADMLRRAEDRGDNEVRYGKSEVIEMMIKVRNGQSRDNYRSK